MKRILLLLCAVLAFSCDETETKKVEPSYRLVEWSKAWIAEHPDALKNQITEKEAEKQLKSDFAELVKNDPDIFKEIPYRYMDMREWDNDNYIVKFESIYISTLPLPICVFSIIPEAEAAKLEKGNYMLSWKSIDCAINADIRLSSRVSSSTRISSDVLTTYNLFTDNLVATGLMFTKCE